MMYGRILVAAGGHVTGLGSPASMFLNNCFLIIALITTQKDASEDTP